MTIKYDAKFVKRLQEILKTRQHGFARLIKAKNNSDLYDYILKIHSNFTDLPFNTIIYWIANEIYDYPKCSVCGINDIPHDRICNPIHGYRSTVCCQSCAQKDKKYRESLKARNRQKYGTDYPQQTKEYKNKLSQTLQQMSDEHWKNANSKRENTCIEKYGVKNVSQNKDIHEKAVSSIKDSFILNNSIEKIKNTKKEKYGDETFSNPKKANETKLINKETIPNYQEKINIKRKNTCNERYGVNATFNIDKCVENSKIARRRLFYHKKILTDLFVMPLFSEEDYILCNDLSMLKWKCKNCGNIITSKCYEHQSHLVRCLKCFPLNSNTSKAEKEIFDFITNDCNIQCIKKDKTILKPQELDIYIPNKKLAIEYDGLYWHSSNLGTTDMYHMNKTNVCENNGIQLIHIFENEWIFKKNIVKSRLKNIFGIFDKTIFARKCKISIVCNNESDEFLEKNHIQGKCKSAINIGLYYDNELISIMTFAKSRYNKKYEYEMLRFCNKLGYHIPGGAGKLLKYFEINYNPKSLISYADRRWSKGKLYIALNFKLDHISSPNYWYWNYKKFNGILESRIKYQKHKLASIFLNFDANLTEYQNMQNNGYMRIFDSGNLVFVKTYV